MVLEIMSFTTLAHWKSTNQLLCRLPFSLSLLMFAQDSTEVRHFWQEFAEVTLGLLSASYSQAHGAIYLIAKRLALMVWLE